jgi:hypothetical protein
MTTTIFHITHLGDLFEVSLRGYVISRITCYIGGSHRQDMQFDDVPTKVQELILDKVESILGES